MRYISTRQSTGRTVSFEHALLQGLARDGGLYLPERWPALDKATLESLRGRPYADVAAAAMACFTGRAFSRARLRAIAAESYAGFDHPATAPLVQLGPDLWLQELFHGPTLAFKDFALQMVARMLDAVLARRGRTATILAATSGDTGAAAIEAFRGRAAVSIVVLHPAGRVSEMQRRQMTCAPEPNVHNVAISGTFDDCQALVKALFADLRLRDEIGLAAVNSINWARVAAQTAYYVHAALALGAPGRAVSFTVPTGNFGNVYAGYAARRMGVPIERLVVATNRNDILARFFATGRLRQGHRAAHAEPQHGHPGREQLRAPARRPSRPRGRRGAGADGRPRAGRRIPAHGRPAGPRRRPTSPRRVPTTTPASPPSPRSGAPPAG